MCFLQGHTHSGKLEQVGRRQRVNFRASVYHLLLSDETLMIRTRDYTACSWSSALRHVTAQLAHSLMFECMRPGFFSVYLHQKPLNLRVSVFSWHLDSCLCDTHYRGTAHRRSVGPHRAGRHPRRADTACSIRHCVYTGLMDMLPYWPGSQPAEWQQLH